MIGCPGSGKSTFARALHNITELPLFYLDMLYWNADKTVAPKALFRERLNKVLEQEAWIIDGNYQSTMELRLCACDTVFFLDYPTEVCLSGIEARKGKRRPDMPFTQQAEYRDEAFLASVIDFPAVSRPQILELLSRYPDKKIVVFQSRTESASWLEQLQKAISPTR